MRQFILSFFTALASLSAISQTNLIVNGSFENASSPWTGWSSSIANGDLWAGQGSCPANTGTDYAWSGDQNQATGVNNLSEDMYQTVSIPSTTTSAVLYFDASINTSESGSSVYDQVEIQIQNTGGTVLQSLGGLNNTHGDYGVSNCQSWAGYYVNIPSNYWGQTIRVVFVFSTDSSYPTIFRIDDVELMVTSSNCSYSLSTTSYTLANNQAGNFNNVASVTAGTGCAWAATVTSGSTWLSTSSTGNGNGQVSITVTQNTGSSDRVGTINIEGLTLTITQPGLVCDYTVSPETYTCPDYHSGTLTNIAIVNTSDGCVWDANVLEGSSWLVTNSNGTGSGTINITVLENNAATPRSGLLVIEGETLLVQQPANPWLTGVEEMAPGTFEVFPNPAQYEVTFRTSDFTPNASITVTDLAGRLIFATTLSSNNLVLDIANWNRGVYHVQFSDGDRIHHTTFIKAD
jgi:hypothetical protein